MASQGQIMLLDARLGNDANDARLHDALLRASQWPNDAHDACLVAVRAWWAIVASQSLHDAHDARLVAVACPAPSQAKAK